MIERTATLYAAGVAAWEAARRTHLSRWKPFEIADLVGWAGYLPLPVLALASVARRRPGALLPLVVPAAALMAEYGRLSVGPRPLPVPPDTVPVRVLTANLLLRNRRAPEVAAMIEALNADVVALHELEPPMARALSDRLGGRYPYMVLRDRPGSWGLGLLSRHPAAEVGEAVIGPHVSMHEVELDVAGRKVSVVSVHPIPPGGGIREYDSRVQEPALDAVMDRASAAPHPVVLVGDFNVADRHPFHRRIRVVYTDAFAVAGRGFGFTWPEPFPVVRIDYVFCDRAIIPVSARTGRIPGSDHRWVMADLAVPRGRSDVTLGP